jgi:hypothetical protein
MQPPLIKRSVSSATFLIWFVLPGLITLTANAQEPNKNQTPIKGSYLYYGQPRIEDNSMFLEEAFNQEKGIIQHINNLVVPSTEEDEMEYSYSEEIHITRRSQFSFSLHIPIERSIGNTETASGLGDTYFSYRYTIMDKYDPVMIIPRITLIVPTGDAQQSLGDGAWGSQLAVAVTKRLHRKLVTHFNVSYTLLSGAERYFYDESVLVAHRTRNLSQKSIGVSGVYLAGKSINFFVEALATRDEDISSNGKIVAETSFVLNPAFRFGFDIGSAQIVPGFGLPFFFQQDERQSTGLFFYLSLEPDHTR